MAYSNQRAQFSRAHAPPFRRHLGFQRGFERSAGTRSPGPAEIPSLCPAAIAPRHVRRWTPRSGTAPRRPVRDALQGRDRRPPATGTFGTRPGRVSCGGRGWPAGAARSGEDAVHTAGRGDPAARRRRVEGRRHDRYHGPELAEPVGARPAASPPETAAPQAPWPPGETSATLNSTAKLSVSPAVGCSLQLFGLSKPGKRRDD